MRVQRSAERMAQERQTYSIGQTKVVFASEVEYVGEAF